MHLFAAIHYLRYASILCFYVISAHLFPDNAFASYCLIAIHGAIDALLVARSRIPLRYSYNYMLSYRYFRQDFDHMPCVQDELAVSA